MTVVCGPAAWQPRKTAQLNACTGGVKWRQGDLAMPAYLDEEFWDEVDGEVDADHPLIEFL